MGSNRVIRVLAVAQNSLVRESPLKLGQAPFGFGWISTPGFGMAKDRFGDGWRHPIHFYPVQCGQPIRAVLHAAGPPSIKAKNPSARIWSNGYDAIPEMQARSALCPSNTPFTVDIPFTAFAPTPGTTIPWNAIGALLLDRTEGTSPLNSPNLAITGHSAIPASDAPGTIPCAN